tara:strand:- start:3959 stop:5320 length:1362 start_codon:yes stop_codon:yes gene_type:complete
MAMQIYDSLSRDYVILKKSQGVKIYVCGITTSGFCHLGHAFSSIIFEVLDRFLSYKDFNVFRVQNFTDIDDKIIDKAKEENSSMELVAKKYILEFFVDMDSLGVKRASLYPKATDEIDNIIDFISSLENKGLTYKIDNGVYFKSTEVKDYGKLSGRNLDGALEGTRIEVEMHKENQTDFVLWKSSNLEEPGWDSPWGRGRPGWHIECSSMVLSSIGETVDIHGGGIDLIFPHHENEIAQSESLTGKQFSNIWMHNGMVQLSGEKMSKSLGNLITVRDAVRLFDVDCIRMWVLSSHYRSPLVYSPELIESHERPLGRLREALKNESRGTKEVLDASSELSKFNEAMQNDLNTPIALSQALILAKKINRANNSGQNTDSARKILELILSVLGLCQKAQNKKTVAISNLEIEVLIEERNAFRIEGDYENSDRIRGILIEEGVRIIDSHDGTSWEFI